MDDAWLEASLSKGMYSIDAGDYIHGNGSVGLEPVLDFCFGDRPEARRSVTARLRWADEEAVLNRIVQACDVRDARWTKERSLFTTILRISIVNDK